MKPVATTITEVDNLPGEEVKFSISDANSAWVMRSMADLYSNRELACVREYSTNAYDSNKELAIANGAEVAPIHVTLPSAMNPYFEVKDYGVGMSETELKEIYTQFGESTKRDSNEYNGMLGFGSKSGIAYTNTFTVTSVKDNRKTVAVVTRREDAMGGYLVTLKIILSVSTTENSGVTIQIPVHNWREFEQKANDFYRFWKPGTVLVNGKEPLWAVGEKIDEGLYYYPQNGTSYVVMGNVPYRIENPDALFPRGMNRISFVAYVPLGAVEFTPSREDLKYSAHTKQNLHKIIKDFIDKSVDTAKNEIVAAATHAEAYKSWSKWRSVIGAGQVDDLTFKGDKLVDEFNIAGDRYDTNSYRYTTYAVKSWYVADMHRTLIVSGFEPTALTAAHKKKVKDWLNFKSMSSQYIIFSDDDVKSPWVDPERIVSWKQVKDETPKPARKPRAQNVAWGRKAGSFDLIARTGRKDEQDVPQSKNLYYIMVQEFNVRRDLVTVLDEFDLDDEVVLVPANRKDKFLRFYPHAKPILPELKTMVDLDGPSLISPEGQIYLSTNRNEASILTAMDPNKVDDPAMKVLINIFKKGEEHYTKTYNANLRLARTLDIASGFKMHSWTSVWERKGRPLAKDYPMAEHFSTYGGVNSNEHVYFYMNALWRARKDGTASV